MSNKEEKLYVLKKDIKGANLYQFDLVKVVNDRYSENDGIVKVALEYPIKRRTEKMRFNSEGERKPSFAFVSLDDIRQTTKERQLKKLTRRSVYGKLASELGLGFGRGFSVRDLYYVYSINPDGIYRIDPRTYINNMSNSDISIEDWEKADMEVAGYLFTEEYEVLEPKWRPRLNDGYYYIDENGDIKDAGNETSEQTLDGGHTNDIIRENKLFRTKLEAEGYLENLIKLI